MALLNKDSNKYVRETEKIIRNPNKASLMNRNERFCLKNHHK